MDVYAITTAVHALAALLTNVLSSASSYRPVPACVPGRDSERELAERLAWDEIHAMERIYQ